MICGNAAGNTSHTIHIRDHVDLDAAQTRESAPARVKGLRGGGGQARFKLTATHSLSGTNQSASKAQDGPLASSKQCNRLVAYAGGQANLHTALFRLASIRGTRCIIVVTCAERVAAP